MVFLAHKKKILINQACSISVFRRFCVKYNYCSVKYKNYKLSYGLMKIKKQTIIFFKKKCNKMVIIKF